MLTLGLRECWALGLGRVLLTRDHGNEASCRIILATGGIRAPSRPRGPLLDQLEDQAQARPDDRPGSRKPIVEQVRRQVKGTTGALATP